MTYEYLCKSCKHQWEQEQSIKDEAIKDCPKCQKPEAQRQISGSGFILNGSGWFKSGGY